MVSFTQTCEMTVRWDAGWTPVTKMMHWLRLLLLALPLLRPASFVVSIQPSPSVKVASHARLIFAKYFYDLKRPIIERQWTTIQTCSDRHIRLNHIVSFFSRVIFHFHMRGNSDLFLMLGYLWVQYVTLNREIIILISMQQDVQHVSHSKPVCM